MMLQNTAYEPRRTFQSINNDYVSKAQFKQHATQTVHYQTNGTGRDTYINRDNGGFCKMYQPYPYKYGQVGTFTSKRSYASPSPIIAPMNVYYRSDGTGRDSYVIQTNGGLTNTGRMLNYKDAFKRSLRQYDDPRTTNHFPYVKLGGKSAGLEKYKSTNTFSHYRTIEQPKNVYGDNLNQETLITQEQETSQDRFKTQTNESPLQNNKNQMSFTQSSGFYRKRDFLLETQLTFGHKFHIGQQELRKVQKSMDARLSVPRFSRQPSRQDGARVKNDESNTQKKAHNLNNISSYLARTIQVNDKQQ